MTTTSEPVRRTRPRTSERPSSDYVALAQQIRESGLLRRRYGYYWAKLAAVPLAVGGCVAAFVWIGDSWWQVLLAVVFAVLFTQIAFLGHDAAHRQIFRSGKWNDWISVIIGDLFIGMSYGWWQHKHTRHHANPNKEGSDPDIELPVIAVTPAQVQRRQGACVRWLLAHQGWFFFPVLLFEGISLHASSVRRLLARDAVAHRAIEIIFITVRLGGFVALVFLVLSPDKAAVFLAIQLGLFGLYMGMSFAPNHKGMPMVAADTTFDFLRRQVMMSRNIRGNRVLDVMMGGLNYQIEHHLFPSMPRPHLRRAAPIIAEYCRRMNVPYTQAGLLESYGIVVRYINRVGLGERDPFACPLVAKRASIGG